MAGKFDAYRLRGAFAGSAVEDRAIALVHGEIAGRSSGTIAAVLAFVADLVGAAKEKRGGSDQKERSQELGKGGPEGSWGFPLLSHRGCISVARSVHRQGQ